MDIRKLGERIRRRREKRGLRQADIAASLQISAQAVSKWERGENAPDISVLVALSDLLGVSIEWLLGGTVAETDTFEATVFCTSLNGFASRSATSPPREVAAWANGIYFYITDAVKRFDGVPVKYVGDGFLGFFTGANHRERAVRASVMARQLLPGTDLVIVLNTGDIFLGALGHPDYSRPDIIGETVNTAFLVMNWVSENSPSGIGVAKCATAGDMPGISFSHIGDVEVLGSDRPVEIFDPEIKETEK